MRNLGESYFTTKIIPNIDIMNSIMGNPKINLQYQLVLNPSMSESSGKPIAIKSTNNPPAV